MTATTGLTAREINETRMYGCTEADLRESVENSITFKLSGPAMIVAGMMSDAQEEIAYGMDESARQTLNRAKFVLFTYVTKD